VNKCEFSETSFQKEAKYNKEISFLSQKFGFNYWPVVINIFVSDSMRPVPLTPQKFACPTICYYQVSGIKT